MKNMKVELRPGLNVLVGRNNVGKTNLLRAIRHAIGPSASRGDSLWLEEDDFYDEELKAKQVDPQRWQELVVECLLAANDVSTMGNLFDW